MTIESSYTDGREKEVDANKEAISKLFADRSGQKFSLHDVIEAVTGIHMYTSEEERKISVCTEAVQHLWMANELVYKHGEGFETATVENTREY
jgi:hypothetical protein